jgi:hypothetical protein
VNIAKYIPLSLRVKAPTRRARQKLARAPIPITKGKDRAFPRMAAVYMPTPKNAAGASEIYPVGPEKITQLTVRMMYMKMAVSSRRVYVEACKRGIAANKARITPSNPRTKDLCEITLGIFIALPS